MSDSVPADESGIGRIRKLRWKCRRGMKELDILLEDFVLANSESLTQGAWPEFEQLLKLEDDQLWDCMRDPGNAEFSRFGNVVAAIRDLSHTKT